MTAAPDIEAAWRRLEAGDAEGAVGLARQRLQDAPADAGALHCLALACNALGRADEAIGALRRAVSIVPGAPALHNDLATLLRDQGDNHAAIGHYREALRLAPAYAQAAFNLGSSLWQAGDLAGAAEAFGKAAAAAPAWVDAHRHRGNLLAMLKRHAESGDAFAAVVAQGDATAADWFCLGNALSEQGLVEEAIAALRQAVARDPAFIAAQSNLINLMQYRLAFREQAFAAACEFGMRIESIMPVVGRISPSPRADRGLRVGFVSADMRTHSVAYFLEPLLARLDPSRIESTCYYNGAITDAVTERLRALAGRWREIRELDDAAFAQMVRTDGVDILVDLGGHTAFHRLAAMAMKPAPLQVSWMGYPGTTGLHTIDVRIVDARTDPAGMTDRWHTEKLLRLPRPFLCYRPPAAAPLPRTHPAAQGIRFGSFNALQKLSPEAIALWARLVSGVPGATLALKCAGLEEERTRARLAAAFAASGLAPGALILLGHDGGPGGLTAHLERYAAIDIALDPFPYNGTTTTCEALWMGVPVVTLAGDLHAGRVGVSLLEAVGLGRLVAEDEDAYVRIAHSLADEVRQGGHARADIRARVASSRLCDESDFAQAMTEALETAWRDR